MILKFGAIPHNKLAIEACDPAKSALQIERYTCALHALFIDGKVTEIGATAFMLDLLKTPILIPSWVIGTSRTLGADSGVPDHVVQRCLGRMRCFVAMSLSTLRAEFPDWEILQSFTVFDLSAHIRKDMSQHEQQLERTTTRKKLKRLANCFDVPYAELQHQHTHLKLVAEARYKENVAGGNLEAWKAALNAVSDRKVRCRHACDDLRKVLVRYAAFSGCTTQGQESTFSVQQQLLRPRRNQQLPSTEQSELKIVIDLKPEVLDARIISAQKVWAQLYGVVRERKPGHRFDKGVNRGPVKGKASACACACGCLR